MYGYEFEASGPVSFEAKLFLQTRIHTFNVAPLSVSLAPARRAMSPEVRAHVIKGQGSALNIVWKSLDPVIVPFI